MRIPKRLKIGGIKYRVVVAEDWLDRNDADGMHDPNTNTIYIFKSLSPEAKEITMLHEVLHAMNSTMNHEFTDSLAEQLYQFLSDNSLLK